MGQDPKPSRARAADDQETRNRSARLRVDAVSSWQSDELGGATGFETGARRRSVAGAMMLIGREAPDMTDAGRRTDETRPNDAETGANLADEETIPRPRRDATPASAEPGDMEALARKIEPELESRRAEILRHRHDEPEALPHMEPGASLLPADATAAADRESIRPFLTRHRDKLAMGVACGVFVVLLAAAIAL